MANLKPPRSVRFCSLSLSFSHILRVGLSQEGYALTPKKLRMHLCGHFWRIRTRSTPLVTSITSKVIFHTVWFQPIHPHWQSVTPLRVIMIISIPQLSFGHCPSAHFPACPSSDASEQWDVERHLLNEAGVQSAVTTSNGKKQVPCFH